MAAAAGATARQTVVRPREFYPFLLIPLIMNCWRTEGITLALSPVRLGRNPMLAGIKHLNRLEQVLIRSHLEQTNADEALVLDSEGWVTECCAANLFWRKENVVYTPRLDQAGVNGIMRQFCLQSLAQSPFQVVEVYAREDALMQADEMVICNALMPVIPVRACGDKLMFARSLFDFLAPLCEHPNSHEKNVTLFPSAGRCVGHCRWRRNVESAPTGRQPLVNKRRDDLYPEGRNRASGIRRSTLRRQDYQSAARVSVVVAR